MPGKTFLDLLDRSISKGAIELHLGARKVRVGEQDGSPPAAVMRVKDPASLDEILVSGGLALAEAYMRQDFDLDDDDVEGLIAVLLRNKVDAEIRKRLGLTMTLKLAWIKARNRLRGPAANVHMHFDIGNDLYEAFLDETLAYTCGYVTDESASIEEIQIAKYDRIATKLDLREGDRVADLGCGFGGLLIWAAQNRGITGKGLTLSKEQHKEANERIAAAGLADRIAVEYASYETLTGTYDKIVSVGMMEHLRNDEYPICVGRIARQLTPEGRGLIHFIGSNGPELPSDGFVQKYLFPGAHWPCLSVLVSQLERHHLAILDVENLVRHYTITLRKWRDRFRQNYPTLDPQRYDESFRRMWEYYLGAAIASSLISPVALYQILFTADPSAPMPYQRV